MQCYLVIVDKQKNVLVARKKVRGQKFNGKVEAPKVLNYAGQRVFPGGKVEDYEDKEKGAFREFQEETGVDLSKWSGVKLETKEFTKEFSATYYRIKDEDKDKLLKEIGLNLKPQGVNNTFDDELESVEFLALDGAKNDFSNWVKVDDQAEKELLRRQNNYNKKHSANYDYKQKDWFVDIAKYLETKAADWLKD